MSNSYYYLMASLPMLHFSAQPPFSFKRFLEICRQSAGETDMGFLILVGREKELFAGVKQPVLAGWANFEIALRNELVKIRAARQKKDPSVYMRGEMSFDTAVYHIAMNSHRMHSVVEGEKFLDMERWRKLDELGLGHYFDTGALIIYALKLRLLLRWERIYATDGARSMDHILEQVVVRQ